MMITFLVFACTEVTGYLWQTVLTSPDLVMTVYLYFYMRWTITNPGALVTTGQGILSASCVLFCPCRKWGGMWGTLGRTLPGGWGIWPHPSTQPWGGQSGVLCPILVSSVQMGFGAPEASPAESDKDDESTGAPLMKGLEHLSFKKRLGKLGLFSLKMTLLRGELNNISPEIYGRRNLNWINIYLTTKEVTVTCKYIQKTNC